jgi:hypothetical protein
MSGSDFVREVCFQLPESFKLSEKSETADHKALVML